MLQIVRQIFKFIFAVLFIAFISGCSLFSSESEDMKKIVSVSKLFPYPYEAIWRAAQLSVKYPIAVNSMDTGVLETEWIKAIDGFQNPVSPKEMMSSGFRYKIIVNVVKGKGEAKPLVRVSVSKKIERQRDFFSNIEVFHSDGLEEKSILYRIEREIVIDDGVRKSSSKQSEVPSEISPE